MIINHAMIIAIFTLAIRLNLREAMNNRKLAGIVTGIVGVVALIKILNAGMPTPMIQWPLEAYLGVAFSIGWLTGIPAWLAYILAIIVFVLVFWVGYKLGSWLYSLVAGRG